MNNKRIISGLAAVVLTFSGAGTAALTDIANLTLDVAARAEETTPEDTSSEDTSSGETDSEETLPTSGTCGENLTWTVDEEGTLTISGTGDMYDYTKEDSPTWRYLDIKKAVIEDGVTKIGSYAFVRCYDVESISIPDSVTSIGDTAFARCNSLKTLTIPDSVTSIGTALFNCNEGIESIVIPGTLTSIPEVTFSYCTNLKSVTIPDSVTSIDQGAFMGCTSLENITIPESVTSIGQLAFIMCTSLKSVTIPENVTSIGDKAFGYDFDFDNSEFSKLENFKLCCYKGSEGENYAKKNSFEYELVGISPNVPILNAVPGNRCVTLSWNAIENAEKYAVAVEVDGKWTIAAKTDETSYVLKGLKDGTEYNVAVVAMFDGEWNKDFSGAITVSPIATAGTCGENLTWTLDKNGTLTVSGTGDMDDYTVDGDTPWSVAEVKNVVIGDGVTSIGECAFLACENLESVTIPDSVTSIGFGAFAYCSILGSVTLPDSVTNIDEFAFDNCKSLKSINIPDGVTNLGENAFQSCSSLESIVIPDGIMYIGNNTFYNCASLKSVKIGNGVTGIDKTAFYGCTSLESLTIPGSVESIGYGAFAACSSLKSAELGDGVTEIGEFAFEGCKSLTNINIPDGVTTIGISAFQNCSNLKSVTIPDSVTSIGNAAFISCSNLESLVLGNGITNIDTATFCDCASLTSITIPDSVTTIGQAAFQECTSLESITFGKGVTSIGIAAFYRCNLTSVTIPDSVTDIDIAAFYECASLESVTLPDSLTTIGQDAFEGCDIKEIVIPSSVTSIDGHAFGYNPDYEQNIDVKIEDFKIYCYKDTAGEQYAIDNGFDYELLDETPANPVPTATPGDNCVTLDWEATENAEKYAVAVEVDGKWTLVEKTADTTYVLKGLKTGTEYNVAVIAMYDGKWNKDFSGTIVVTPNEAVSGYPTVTNIDYSEKYHQFRLTWNAVEGAEEYGIAVKIGDEWKVQARTDKTKFTSPKLKEGSTVEMVICAKVNGKWDTSDLDGRAFTVTVK